MTAIATTAAAATIVGDRSGRGHERDGDRGREDRARDGDEQALDEGRDRRTCRPEAPRLRASAIVARRRRAASTAISPSVATPTSAGPSAITAMIPSAAAQRAWCASSIVAIPVRSAVSVDGVTFADG